MLLNITVRLTDNDVENMDTGGLFRVSVQIFKASTTAHCSVSVGWILTLNSIQNQEPNQSRLLVKRK